MGSAFTVPQLHKVAARTIASPGKLLPQHLWVMQARGEHTVPIQGRIVSSERDTFGSSEHEGSTSFQASAMGNEFTVLVQGRIESSERDGQRVHRPAAP